MGTELATGTAPRVWLTGLSAPGPLADLAQPYRDLRSCWNSSPSPELLLWLAARLSTTPGERRAVVACLAETSVSESAGYLVSALAHSRPARRDPRAERQAAKLVRRRLPCPRLDPLIPPQTRSGR